MTFIWTDETVATLRQLWTEGGTSAGVIATRLGCTRNAVLGKVHRLRLPQRKEGGPVKRLLRWGRGVARAQPARPIMVRQLPPPRLNVSDVHPVLSGDAAVTVATVQPGQCRWPFADPGMADFCFCAKPQVEGKSYCAYHCDVARRVA